MDGVQHTVKMGGVWPGAYAPDNVIRIAKSVLGLPVQLVTGYKGTPEYPSGLRIRRARRDVLRMVLHELHLAQSPRLRGCGGCLQGVAKPMPDLPKVPLAIQLAKTEEARRLVQAGIYDPSVFARPLSFPPGLPKRSWGFFGKL